MSEVYWIASGPFRSDQPWEVALFFLLPVGWLASLVLIFVNPCLVYFSQSTGRYRLRDMLIWATYVGIPFIFLAADLAGSRAWGVMIVAVPIAIISHFASLIVRRRMRAARERAQGQSI